MLPSRKMTVAAAVTAALGAGTAQAAQVPYAMSYSSSGVSNFTMLTPEGTGCIADCGGPDYNGTYGGHGYAFGGTNNVTFTWDGTIFTSDADYTGPGGISNATLSSPQGFFGYNWTAHTVQIFGPGTYSFDTALGSGNTESGTLTMTVADGQLGVHLLFDWNENYNIDIVNVWDINSTFSNCGSSFIDPSAQNCLYTGNNNTAGNTASTVWLFASTDDDGDGTLGVAMAPGGPFAGFNANFNLVPQAVPVPAAIWLFGSGLLGLMGIARRKELNEKFNRIRSR